MERAIKKTDNQLSIIIGENRGRVRLPAGLRAEWPDGRRSGLRQPLIRTARQSMEKDIEDHIIKALDFLVQDHGFRAPIRGGSGTQTTIAFLHDQVGVAVEIEVDVRESQAFCHIVRLEEGALPDGYYVSHGRSCRLHLKTLLREKRWVDLQRVPTPRRTKTARPGSMPPLRTTVDESADLLRDSVQQILDHADDIFPESQS